jgi:hypothetical protein
MLRMIDDHYKKLKGVPVRYWQLIEQRVSASWNKIYRPLNRVPALTMSLNQYARSDSNGRHSASKADALSS